MQKIIRQAGTPVLGESRLMSLLADYKAFDDFPAMREVMKALLSVFGKELNNQSRGGDDAGLLSCADDLKFRSKTALPEREREPAP